MKNPHEKLWHDVMTIKRWFDVVTGGITSQELKPVYSGVKCHYSKGTLSVIGSDGAPTLINKYSLFCAADTDLQEGDVVEVTQRNGKVTELTVGEGFPYSDHQEFTVKRTGTA